MEKIEENIVYSVFKEIYIKGISNNTREISTNEVGTKVISHKLSFYLYF